MKISIGADHRGFDLKAHLIEALSEHTWFDVGTNDTKRVDYPPFAKEACASVLRGKAERGLLICGSGAGMAIAANRFNGIYAAVCWDVASAQIARQDDGINVLVLASDFVNNTVADAIVRTWIETPFKAGRYQERLAMVDALTE